MFFFLSKTIYLAAMPIIWVFGLLLYAFWVKRKRKKNIALGCAIVLFYLQCNSALINRLMLAWEVAPVPFEQLGHTYETGVVLSGVLQLNKSPHDRFYTQKGADRILHAALLYQKGHVKNLLVTGSYTKLTGERKSAAEQMKELLLLCGVPDSVILMEHAARNTRENATFSAELLEQKGMADEKVLLITSAFHIRRSMGCFAKAGLQADPFPADVYTIDPDYNFSTLFIPNEQAFATANLLAHEIVGYIVYKIIGYA